MDSVGGLEGGGITFSQKIWNLIPFNCKRKYVVYFSPEFQKKKMLEYNTASNKTDKSFKQMTHMLLNDQTYLFSMFMRITLLTFFVAIQIILQQSYF